VKLRYCFIYLLASCLLPALIGCTTAPEELLEAEYNNLPYSDGVLVLEQAFSSTSATGTCTSQVIERWYGSDKESRDLLGSFESLLPSKNWMV
jgi:hypothetical protein